jgi:hypothetical protein
MFVRIARISSVLAITAVSLTACQQPYAMHLPDAPVAREVWPDQDAYRRFRADADKTYGAVTLCEIEHVGSLPTSA